MSATGLPPEEQSMAVPVSEWRPPLRPLREPQPGDPVVGKQYRLGRTRESAHFPNRFFPMTGTLGENTDRGIFVFRNLTDPSGKVWDSWAVESDDDSYTITEVKGGRRRRSRKTKRRARKTRRNYK